MDKNEFKPSKYQLDIFDFIEHGNGNAVIEASAGAGKTTVLTKCVDLIDDNKRILITAFNKDIVDELKKKISNKRNIETRTLHGMGLLMLKKNYGDKISPIPDNFKYSSYIINNCSLNNKEYSKQEHYTYIDNIIKYTNFGRYYLSENIEDMDFIEERYNIDTVLDEKEVALKVMEWGAEHIETIDYTDMIWLPNKLHISTKGILYDWIFVDEANDLQKAEREMLLKCKKINTRMCFFGESNQAIYGFSGSDPQSFNELRKLPNTISLPLSITYRCAKNIVDFVKKIVPTIEPNNDGRMGEIIYDAKLSDVHEGDMILCRTNAPLIKIYCELIKNNKKCFIMGKDIGNNLKKTVKATKENNLNVNLSKKGVFSVMYKSLFGKIHSIMNENNITFEMALEDASVNEKIDTIQALEVLSEKINTSDVLMKKIDTIFSNKSKKGISLSTIHKAKGLESDNVFIACKSLMPSKTAKKEWEKKQEKNLMYVAYTRAKNKLAFLDENEFKEFKRTEKKLSEELEKKEKKIDRLYGKTAYSKPRKKILSNANNALKEEKIQISHKKTNINLISNKDEKNTDLSGIFKNKHKNNKIIKI